MQKKTRLDVAVFEGGYAPSREKAKAIIMAGQVYVNNQKVDKAGFELKEGDKLEVRGKALKYVSRGGLKLEKAMQVFSITLADKTCMDVGASTGGFTDCMLQNGAKRVYSVDVGYGQLEVVERVIGMATENGFSVLGLEFSPVKGPEGNIEYLLYVEKSEAPAVAPEVDPAALVGRSHEALV